MLLLAASACARSGAPLPFVPADAGAIIDAGGGREDAGRPDVIISGPLDAGLAPDAGGLTDDAGLQAKDCDPVSGDGCAPGRVCVLNFFSRPICAPEDEVRPGLGDDCTPGKCGEGAACAAIPGDDVLACRRVCDLMSGIGCEALGPDHECRARLAGTGWGLCAPLPPECDPANQRPCAETESCQVFVHRSGSRSWRCGAAGVLEEGASCGASYGTCQRGLVCVSSRDGSAGCRRYCQRHEDCEPFGQRCSGVVMTPPFRYCGP